MKKECIGSPTSFPLGYWFSVIPMGMRYLEGFHQQSTHTFQGHKAR